MRTLLAAIPLAFLCACPAKPDESRTSSTSKPTPAATSASTSSAPPAATSAASAAAPESEDFKVGKEIIDLYAAAVKAGEENKTDCKAFGAKLAPLRDKLWDIGKAHPSVLKNLSNEELRSLKAVDTQKGLEPHLIRCKDDVHAKEFVFAMGKVL